MKEMLEKVKKHGILGSLKVLFRKLIFYCNHKSPWPFHPKAYAHWVKMITAPLLAGNKKRILGIWDFKALPWAVGDPLVFVEKLSVLKIEHNAEEVDICIVYDRQDPQGNRKPDGVHKFESNFTSENSRDYMLDFLPLFSTCPYLGSVFQFSSRDEFRFFLNKNLRRYHSYPPLSQHLAETYNFRGGEPHVGEIQEFYNARGYIPHLRIGERDTAWARWFYSEYLPARSVAVTLSMKRTAHAIDRNADPQTWLAFIDKCKEDFPEVTFVFIGLREEAFDELRKKTNVRIAKDYGTCLNEDFALIRNSIMYMGTSSGINVIALFSDLPYLTFQSPNIKKYGLTPGGGFAFSTDKQKTFGTETRVTTDLLYEEFRKIYLQLDRDKWLKALKEGRSKDGLPAARGLIGEAVR